MTTREPRNPTDFDHFVRFIVACLAFAFLCIALGACKSEPPKCGVILSKWSEPTFKAYNILYMATIRTDEGEVYSVSCGRNSWGAATVGSRICGSNKTDY